MVLTRSYKDVAHVKYDGEGHVILSYANQVDFWNRLIAWFDKYLKALAKTESRKQ